MHIDQLYVIHVEIQRPGDVESTLGFFCTIAEPDEDAIRAFAEKLGLGCVVDVVVAPLYVDDGSKQIAQWFGRMADNDPAPVIGRTPEQIAIDELRRSQRNTDRKLDAIEQLMKTISAGLLDREVAPIMPSQLAPPASTEPFHTITHPAAREPLPSSRRDGRGRTDEMGADDPRAAIGSAPNQGNMNLVGPAATSQIMELGIDREGKPALVVASLPKVGDSLKPFGQRG